MTKFMQHLTTVLLACILVASAASRAEAQSSNSCVQRIDFNSLAAGEIVSSVLSTSGVGPIGVNATNPRFPIGTNAAIIYDSNCPGACSGQDPDLGTPNVDFGGPGRGAGGGAGSAFANTAPFGNVLIVAENLVDGDGDGFIDIPDDQSDELVTIHLDFSIVAPVLLRSIAFVDLEAGKGMATVELFDLGGAPLGHSELPRTGNNGVASVDLAHTNSVAHALVTLQQSGAIAELTFESRCDDGDSCTIDSCGLEGCLHTPVGCDDGDPCTVDSCWPEGCLHDSVDCDDGDPCTQDSCGPAGCVNVPIICDNGIFCDGPESCVEGLCVPGSPPCGDEAICNETGGDCLVAGCVAVDDPSCDDGNPCTDDTCDVGTGNCINLPNTAACTDGTFCNGAEHCLDGVCVAGPPPCNDGGECARHCDEAAASCLAPSSTPCSADGNPCTDDTCDGAGTCLHLDNSAPCDDGDLCNGSDTCAGGACSLHAGDPCGVGERCDPESELCVVLECVTDNDPACNDDNECTDDSCDVIAGACMHTPNTGPCDDSIFCNGTDSCSDGQCSVHAGTPCAGGPECLDLCNEEAGNCFVPAGTSCTDDGNPCTDDVCDTGVCTHQPNTGTCNDGLFCNGEDRCESGSCSTHEGDPCAGASECAGQCDETADSCLAASGTACTSDGNECTDDTCDGSGTCIHEPNQSDCNDGIFCNGTDSCSGGSCSTHAGSPCANGPDCLNQCNETQGNCIAPGGTACTSDGNDCTDDMCDEAGTCTHAPNDSACDDGLFCNGVDSCSEGSCSVHSGDPCAGDSNECSDQCSEDSESCFLAAGASCSGDGNECTDDECDGAGTCVHDFNDAQCNDGVFCNGADTCAAGECAIHAGDPCIEGSCEEETQMCIDTCVSPPRLALNPLTCTVGQPCEFVINLEAGTAQVASFLIALVTAADIDCANSCEPGEASEGACFTNAAGCVFSLVDFFPPIEAFDDGEVLLSEITCNESGTFEIGLADVAMGTPEGTVVADPCGSGATLTCTDSSLLCGDADNSGLVTTTDALAVMGYSIGLYEDCPMEACDADLSGAITSNDAFEILYYAVDANETFCTARSPTSTGRLMAATTSTTMPSFGPETR